MSSEIHSDGAFLLVDGLRIFKSYDIDLFRSALQYKAQADDIFIITHPRSGTHWMSIIVYTLLTNGQAFDKDMNAYLSRSLLIDISGKEAAEKMVRPGAIATHFPFNYVPYNSKSKYIAIIRHPKDVCVSFYQIFLESSESELSDMDFNTFFELFITGQTPYMDYFEYLRLTWLHKDDENVLLVSFEQLKQDLRGIILKVAQFINIDLTNNKELFDQVETYSSFDYMKKNYDSNFRDVLTQCGNNPQHSIKFIRKGLIGDWRSFMTDEQSQRLDAVVAEKTQHMKGLEDFWFPSSTL